MLFQATDELVDFDLGATPSTDSTLPEDIFFLDNTAAQMQNVAVDVAEPVALSQVVETTDTQAADDLFAVAQAAEFVAPTAAVSHSTQMPQDILKVPEQDLTGEWTLEKWEYWFRQSDLSPALQELAQHGLMQGEINAESVFVIAPQYEQLLTSLQSHLEQALHATWPKTRFSVKYQDLSTTTPYYLQAQRKQLAQQRAVELLQNEPVVKDLIRQFDASLDNVQLK